MTFGTRVKLAILLLALLSGSSHAGVRELVSNMFASKIQIRVSVQDEQGQSVPYAT